MIPVTLLEFVVESDFPLDLGANPGSSLRGALYEALAAMYDTGDSVRSRYDFDINPVAWLLRLEDEDKTGGKDTPRPIAIRPPLPLRTSGEGSVMAETRLAFIIALYGRGRDAAGLIISAVASMGKLGVGRGRGKFELRGVRVRDPLTAQPTEVIDAHGQQVAEMPPPLCAETYQQFAARLQQDQLTVRFITPTRIVDRRTLCGKPIFRAWFQRLIERTRLISELYAEPVWIPFRELLKQAETIELIKDETRWQEMWSHSRYDGTYKPVSGFVGAASYTGKLEPLLPYVLLGQALQVGKNAIKGCGWYEISDLKAVT